MIEIKIDYNNDVIRTYRDGKEIWELKILYARMRDIQGYTYELINLLKDNERNVRLSKIDEDTETTIDEW